MKAGESSALINQPNSRYSMPVATSDVELGSIGAQSNIYEVKNRPRRDICEQ